MTRIGFYAPLKPPTHPWPSGDRAVARGLVEALLAAGHEVELMSPFRSREGAGDVARQHRLRRLGERLAARLLRRLRARPPAARPALWFTYHLYHKAPDWIGPVVCRGLGIPYVAAEASFAPKRARGPWAEGHAQVARTLAGAAAVVSLNPADDACVAPLLADPSRLHSLLPFMDIAAFLGNGTHGAARATLARELALEPGVPWILCAAMMRRGAKLASYALLADALAPLADRPWRLLVAGDGDAAVEVRARLARLPPARVALLGVCERARVAELCLGCDLFAWPAVHESFGMALLEAQAAGLPVVAGRSGGVAAVVRDGETGLLCEPGRAGPFADALGRLLVSPALRQAQGAAARRITRRDHDLPAAAATLDRIVRAALATRGAVPAGGAVP